MNEGLYPLTEKLFKALVEPIIEKNYTWKGRPPKISHYQVFCAILYIFKNRSTLERLTSILWQMAYDIYPLS